MFVFTGNKLCLHEPFQCNFAENPSFSLLQGTITQPQGKNITLSKTARMGICRVGRYFAVSDGTFSRRIFTNRVHFSLGHLIRFSPDRSCANLYPRGYNTHILHITPSCPFFLTPLSYVFCQTQTFILCTIS